VSVTRCRGEVGGPVWTTCGAGLKGDNYKGIEVDKCVGCEGMWLDSSQLDQLEDKALDADELKGSMVTRPVENELPCRRCHGARSGPIPSQ